MKCSKCNREAVYHARYSGRYYCKKHFNELVEKRFKETVKRYRLIEKGERIAVASPAGRTAWFSCTYSRSSSRGSPSSSWR